MLRWDYLKAILPEQQKLWAASPATRHVLIDDFLDPAICADLYDLSPVERKLTQPAMRKHKHVRGKSGTPRPKEMTPLQAGFFDAINSPEFLRYMEELTGIRPLYADPELNGGGLHVSRPGGYLNVHTDFNFHPTTKKQRRLNLLLYLNRDWQDAWNGHIELWDRNLERPFLRAAPSFNRVLLFETSEDSYHGHPLPLQTPPGVYRASLAVYYYADWPAELQPRSQTDYQLVRWQWAQLTSRIAGLLDEKPLSADEVVAAIELDYMTGDIRQAHRALTALRQNPVRKHRYWAELISGIAERLGRQALSEGEAVAALQKEFAPEDIRAAYTTLKGLRSPPTVGEVYWELPGGVYSLVRPPKQPAASR